MEKREESSQGLPRKGYTRADNPMSQTSSNRTIPVPQTESRDRHVKAHGGVPTAQSKQTGTHGEELNPTQSLRSANSDNSKGSEDTPKTLMFDLNAVPDLEEGEVQQEEGSCDLYLNLMLPATGAQLQQDLGELLLGNHNHQSIQISDSQVEGVMWEVRLRRVRRLAEQEGQ